MSGTPLSFISVPTCGYTIQRTAAAMSRPIVMLRRGGRGVSNPGFMGPLGNSFRLLTDSPYTGTKAGSGVPKQCIFESVSNGGCESVVSVPIKTCTITAAAKIIGPSMGKGRFIIRPSSPIGKRTVRVRFRATRANLCRVRVLSVSNLDVSHSSFCSGDPLLLSTPSASKMCLLGVGRSKMGVRSTGVVIH